MNDLGCLLKGSLINSCVAQEALKDYQQIKKKPAALKAYIEKKTIQTQAIRNV